MSTSLAQSTSLQNMGGAVRSARIDYIDGIRGLAALAVVFVHVFEAFGLDMHWAGIISDGRLTGQGIDRYIPTINSLTRYGAYAVELFIVVSGYSLMLAIAKSADGKPKGGLRGYFTRRIRRIWPPYYAALGIGLLLIALIPAMNTKQNIWWDQALPAFRPDVIVSHLLFLQHLSPDWLQKINPAMWTIAIEEMIYLIFPFFLLPIWRRWGSVAMVIAGVGAGSAVWYLFYSLFQVANPWYLGLFALGAMGASISFSNREKEQRWRKNMPWLPIGLILFVVFVALDVSTKQSIVARTGIDLLQSAPWLIDVTLGASVASLLVYLTEQWRKHNETGKLPRFHALRILQSKPIQKLGTFTYSLYLIHPPLLTLVTLAIIGLGITSWQAYALEVVIGVPFVIIGAYIFHLIFERPFMPSYLAKAKTAPVAVSGLQAEPKPASGTD
ncbi:MAG: acyltransferase [Anaerolineae bacterium]|nr:acyltransferase [Anaerolineae bacterium]